MRSIPKPTTQADTHFTNCASGTYDRSLKGRLDACLAPLLLDAATYDAAGTAQQLFTLTKRNPTAASDGDLQDLYKRTMSNKRGRGRGVYDILLHSAPRGLCPSCLQRPAKSLDHYLPKEAFPLLSVLPINLVPACSDCNKEKGTYTAGTAETQLFHPYYDTLEEGQWLFADLIFVDGQPTVQYRADPPSHWAEPLASRVEFHFNRMKLADLYNIYGSGQIPMIRQRLRNLWNAGGRPAVEAHLYDEWETRDASDPNSWQTSAYQAMYLNSDFCDGQFGS